METLLKKTLVGFIQLIIGLVVMIFVPAGTFDFWQAWVYLGIFAASTGLIFAYLYKNDIKLLEARLNRTEKQESQKGIQLYMYMAYISVFVLPSLDHRFGWSHLDCLIVIVGDLLVAFGYFIIFRVLKENPFAAATIEIATDQKVISTGPYAIIRHPMYAGAVVMLLGTPLALGSWWGLLILVPITFILVLRLLDEEKILSQGLTGYKEYSQKTRFRLIPFIW